MSDDATTYPQLPDSGDSFKAFAGDLTAVATNAVSVLTAINADDQAKATAQTAAAAKAASDAAEAKAVAAAANPWYSSPLVIGIGAVLLLAGLWLANRK